MSYTETSDEKKLGKIHRFYNDCETWIMFNPIESFVIGLAIIVVTIIITIKMLV